LAGNDQEVTMVTLLRRYALSAVAGALICAAAPVHAQQPEALSREEVTRFFDSMKQEVNKLVAAGEFDALIDWTQRMVADEAQVFAILDTYAGDERKSVNFFSLNKDEVIQLRRIMFGMIDGPQGDGPGIENYSLDIEVRNVVPAGPNAATVTASFTQVATLSLPRGGAAASATGSTQPAAGTAAGGQSLSIEATANCHMLVRRGEQDRQLLLGLTACNANMRR
jgi:hypothetical protein